jgi:hypothetical protein
MIPQSFDAKRPTHTKNSNLNFCGRPSILDLPLEGKIKYFNQVSLGRRNGLQEVKETV